MKLENINSSLTLIANIGVIIGIVFLALEISQSNRQAESATYQARVNEIDQSLREFALSETMVDLYTKIDDKGAGSLTPSETRRATAWEVARANRMQGQYYQYQQGFLDSQSYDALLAAGGRSLPLWVEFGIDSNPAFSELISAIKLDLEE